MRTRRVAGIGSPHGESFVSWGPQMGFQRQMSSEAPGIIHTIWCLCFVFGTKFLYLLYATQGSPWFNHVRNHQCPDPICLQTLRNEWILCLTQEDKIQPQLLFAFTSVLIYTWCHFFKGCVHIENKYISKILLSWLPFVMNGYISKSQTKACRKYAFLLLF